MLQTGCANYPIDREKPEFILFPGLHKDFLKPIWKFSLSDLIFSLQSQHLDAICIEIPREDYNGDFEGLYPPEAAAISEVFGALVIPADWRAPHRQYKKPSASTEDRIAELKANFDEGLNSSSDKIHFVISSSSEAQIGKIHETIIERDGEEADGFWVSRNQKIAENCLKESLNRHARRVGLVFGIDHLYILKKELADDEYRVSQGDLRLTSEKLLTQAVVQRWQRNLSSLRRMKKVNNPKSEIIDESGRTHDLEQFISRYKN